MATPRIPPVEGRPAWRADMRYPQVIVDETTGRLVGVMLTAEAARVVVAAVQVLTEELPGSCAVSFEGLVRQGSRVPHHVYLQRGPEPDRRPFPDGDPPLGMFVNPVDAEWAVLAVRLQPTLRWLL